VIVDKLEKLPRDKVEQELAALGVSSTAVDGEQGTLSGIVHTAADLEPHCRWQQQATDCTNVHTGPACVLQAAYMTHENASSLGSAHMHQWWS